MGYSINEAKDFVIRAGKILVESGLIARTWGNISARISNTQFVITPSGLAYETLTPEQIVVVNIADCSYEGNRKPSSEKGIHADAYRLRSEVNFIIHTHQLKASVLSIEGKNIKVSNHEYKKILGDMVPCAEYGMPSTNKLRKKVAAVIRRYPNSRAIFMKCHGTLCMGYDLEHAFEIAKTLEKLSEVRYEKVCGKNVSTKLPISDYGRSERRGNVFMLICDGTTVKYKIGSLPTDAPKAAILHETIYKSSKVTHILHTTENEALLVSQTGRILRPYLDDLAQIAGINIKSVKNGLYNVKMVAKRLKHKNAVLLENAGALCTGKSEGDAIAVEMVLKKGCAADLYCTALNHTDWLGFIDASIQRIIYVKKYSKQKGKEEKRNA